MTPYSKFGTTQIDQLLCILEIRSVDNPPSLSKAVGSVQEPGSEVFLQPIASILVNHTVYHTVPYRRVLEQVVKVMKSWIPLQFSKNGLFLRYQELPDAKATKGVQPS